MTPAQNQRFIDYVQRTSRPEVQEQRCKLLSALTGWTCKTARELTASIQGNTNTRKWISEAMQVGEIVRREDGVLILPPPETGSRVDRAVTTWCDAGLELRRALLAAELPMELVEAIRKAEARVIDHFDPLPEDPEETDRPYDPEKDREGDETQTQYEERLARPQNQSYASTKEGKL